MKRDKALDYIRVMSMASIVLCHYFQIRGNAEISSWLNIGVQIFFILSARLICQKQFTNKKDIFLFFKTRILRIFIPVWIYLVCIIPALFVVGRGPKISAIIMYFFGLSGFAKSGVLGLGHFWYITVMLICYLLAPILCKIAVMSKKSENIKGLLLQGVFIICPTLVFMFTQHKYYGVNISLFVASYFLFYKIENNEQRYKSLALKVLPFAAVASVIRIIADDTDMVENQFYDGVFVTLTKAVLGLFLFFLFYNIFSYSKTGKVSKIIGFLSEISYEIYIVHQFILLALYEFIPFFKGTVLGAVLMLGVSVVLVFVNTVIVYYIKNFIEKRIFKK